MAATKIMLIRHAEKPNGGTHGVDPSGERDDEDLTVRGWQRAGALARLFLPASGTFSDPRLATPHTIFASGAGKHSKSRRPEHTVGPLAELIGTQIVDKWEKGEEREMAEAAVLTPGVVLISWQHEAIPDIVGHIVGSQGSCPGKWLGERFDMVWVLDRPGGSGSWAFAQVPQMLLAGDRIDPIPFKSAGGAS